MILHPERRRTALRQALHAQPGLSGYELAKAARVPSFLTYPQLRAWEREGKVRAWWGEPRVVRFASRRRTVARRFYALTEDP